MIEIANIDNLILWVFHKSLFLPQLVSRPLWCWVRVTQKSLLFSPSLSAGRESAVDALMTTFEYGHFSILITNLPEALLLYRLYLCPDFSGSNWLTCSFFFFFYCLGHGERGQCVQKWTTGTTPGTPAPDQSDFTPVCLPRRLFGDWRTRRQRGGTARVSPRKDVPAHCQVHGRKKQLANSSQTFGQRRFRISIDSLYLWRLALFLRGPNRLKPFKYNHPQGFFSHRWICPCDSPYQAYLCDSLTHNVSLF